MVTNTELQKEFDMFSNVWNFYKKALPVHGGEDVAYWEEIERSANDICQDYNTELCREFVIVILNDLDRRLKAYDGKIAKQSGCQGIL